MLALLLCVLPSQAMDILFVGNSYTAYNDLSARVADVFAKAAVEASTDKLTAGGLNLADHASRAADPSTQWYAKLVTEGSERQWVVLQDQSQVPGFPETESMWIASRDGAIALNAKVADVGAETMFFVTWGRRAGDPMNDWLYPDFSAMQERLSLGYLAYADAVTTPDRPVWVAPVGPAFQAIHDEVSAAGMDPTEAGNDFYVLYSGDGSHPSAIGTQLAAYVFYACLSGESPVGLAAPDGMDEAQAMRLQETAAAVVFVDDDPFACPGDAVSSPDTGDPEADPDEEPDEDPDEDPDEEPDEDPDEEPDEEPEGDPEDGQAAEASDSADDYSREDSEKQDAGGCAAHQAERHWLLLTLTVFAAALRRRS